MDMSEAFTKFHQFPMLNSGDIGIGICEQLRLAPVPKSRPTATKRSLSITLSRSEIQSRTQRKKDHMVCSKVIMVSDLNCRSNNSNIWIRASLNVAFRFSFFPWQSLQHSSFHGLSQTLQIYLDWEGKLNQNWRCPRLTLTLAARASLASA